MRRLVAWLSVGLTFTSASWAQVTYCVDDSGGQGVDFTSLQAALDVAGPQDLVVVKNGAYGPVVTQGATTVMGVEANVQVSSFEVKGLPFGSVFVLTDLDVSALSLQDCSGTFLCDNVTSTGLDARNAGDIRFQNGAAGVVDVRDSVIQIIGASTRTCTVSNTTLVAANSVIRGRDGSDGGTLCSPPGDGTDGLVAREGSNVRLLQTVVEGGDGGYDFCCCPAFDGDPGKAIVLTEASSVVRDFGVPQSQDPCCGSSFNRLCTFCESIDQSSSIEVMTNLPSIRLTGGNQVGSLATYTLRAGPNTSLRAFSGALPSVRVLGGFDVPLFNSIDRGLSLGSAPASGVVQFTFAVPPQPKGTLIFAQNLRTLSTGATSLGNSVALVIR